MSYNFNENLERDQKEYGSGQSSGYYNVEDGSDNIIRVLTPGAVYVQYYYGQGIKSVISYGYNKGDPRGKNEERKMIKYAMYVLDRKDNQIKLATFSYSVVKGIGDLQKNPDYKFTELPMPYDIRITYNKDEVPASKYKISFKPNSTTLTQEQLNELQEKMSERTPEQIVERMKEKQIDLDKQTGIWLSPEQLQQDRKDFVEKANNEMKEKIASGEIKMPPKIDYPTDDINPEDIPF